MADTEENKWEPVPETLEQAIEKLRGFPGWEEAALKHSETHFAATAHFGGGMAMRNNWRLHSSEPGTIGDWFRQLGVRTADSRSSLILKAFWHAVNNIPFDVEKEVWPNGRKHNFSMYM